MRAVEPTNADAAAGPPQHPFDLAQSEPLQRPQQQTPTQPARPQYAYAHELLPNEARKIVCNRTATIETDTKRVVWRFDDDVVCHDDDEHEHATPDADDDHAPGDDASGRHQPLGSTAVEAVERLAEEGRGRRTGDGRFVRSLQLGDVVTVWAKARFPHWANHVRKITVDVYFAV